MPRRQIRLIIFIASILLFSRGLINAQDMKHNKNSYTNHLIHETSPYLLQHAHQPVNWFPWGDEALSKAKDENKLLLISIGYSACHWCHVMAHESFDDTAIARIMNENFVCIKVDREERPDVDQVYMDAVQVMTGSGGWPLNCFALPNGDPVYGGTYFRPGQWKQVIRGLAASFHSDPSKFYRYAEELKSGLIKYNDQHSEIVIPMEKFDLKEMDAGIKRWAQNFDRQFGGNNGAPKFPMPAALQFLLDYSLIRHDKEVFDHVERTLKKMVEGGIYDQIGGGFARYSTDAQWKVAHFEKMLYDNAQLISLYSKMFKFTGDEFYSQVVKESIEFVHRELTSPEGAFYAALDADSEGEEGRFYVWSDDEVEALSGEASEIIKYYFGIGGQGRWEGKNILLRAHSLEETSLRFGMNQDDVEKLIQETNEKLLSIRNQRIHPGLDDKILCSWNAMMIIALLDAYQASGNKLYYERAHTAIHFIFQKMMDSKGELYRSYKNGQAKIGGFLDDYAFLLAACFKFYESDGNEDWLKKAEDLLGKINTDFVIEDETYYTFRSKKADLLYFRKKDLSDNVIPSANSVMAQNLFFANSYLDDGKNLDSMLSGIMSAVLENPAYYSNWGRVILYKNSENNELVICGKNAIQQLREANEEYLPGLVKAASENESERTILKDRFIKGQTLIYRCVDKTCDLPVKELAPVLNELKSNIHL